MSPDNSDKQHEHPDRPEKFEIKIDRTNYKVSEPVLTGADLRRLPEPDIGPERDLFEVVPGGTLRSKPTRRSRCAMVCASSPRRRRSTRALTEGENNVAARRP